MGAGTITLPDGGAGYVLWRIPESWYAAGYENIGLLVLSPSCDRSLSWNSKGTST